MDLPLYKTFTEEQCKKFGPVRTAEEFGVRRRVYETPFLYANVAAGDFYEIDPDKGIEFKADDGFLTITEDRPIVGVTVVGSGCTRGGYNIVEWWDEGETIDNMKNHLLKRQRTDGLNGIHPNIWTELFRRVPWVDVTYADAAEGEIKDAVDMFRRLTRGWYDNLETSFYENTVYFRVGSKFHHPTKVTVRCGCKGTEDLGTSLERYPADYAIRLVETQVMA